MLLVIRIFLCEKEGERRCKGKTKRADDRAATSMTWHEGQRQS